MDNAAGIAASASAQIQHDGPIATFYRLVPECRLPIRADRAAAGTMPTRAFRYCEPMTSASAFGWYVFPPITFSLMWEGGAEIFWTYKGQEFLVPSHQGAISRLRRLLQHHRAGGGQRFFAVLPVRVQGARGCPNLEWTYRSDHSGMEPARPGASQLGAKSGIRKL